MQKITQVILIAALFLCSLVGIGQNINFTIDTATTSGSSIVETITDNGNTYVLTASHSANDDGVALFDNGGGDLLFFWQGGAANTSWDISITENGLPIAFDLVSFDFESFGGTHTYNITNGNNDPISTSVSIDAGQSGNFPIDTVTNTIGIDSFIITGTTASSLFLVDFHNININPGSILSIDEEERSGLRIYPIPARNFINIETNTLIEKSIKLFDITGKLILNTKISSGRLDIGHLSNGLYIVEVKENNFISSSKLIIQH